MPRPSNREWPQYLALVVIILTFCAGLTGEFTFDGLN